MAAEGAAIAGEEAGAAIDPTRRPRPARDSPVLPPARRTPQHLEGIIIVGQKYWHVPIPSRPICPVCKKAVYSRAGIHPQCAVSQAESLRPVKPEPSHPEAPASTK